MHYKFPEILHIDDVLPAIKDSPEFIVVEKDGYKVINYVVSTEDTFPVITDRNSTIRRECRGLIFSMNGKIINRRYHKFFNIHEKAETHFDMMDFKKPHHILEKLDGSMVTPCMVDGNIRWMTKMGITDTSMSAEVFVANNRKYDKFATFVLYNNYTPIFEWVSKSNRIVLDYQEDNLILTALRENVSGEYLQYNDMIKFAGDYDIPYVKVFDYDAKNIIEIVRAMEYAEGVVIRFNDGHMVKVKSDWYVRLHKVKAMLGSERDIIGLILNNMMDDLIPLMADNDKTRVSEFSLEVMVRIEIIAKNIYETFNKAIDVMDRKIFAINESKKLMSLSRGIMFKLWDKKEHDIFVDRDTVYDMVCEMIKKNVGSNSAYEKIKAEFLYEINY